MNAKKMLGTTTLAISALAIASATANGQAADFVVQNTTGGIAYTTSLGADHRSATIDLASGHFVTLPDGSVNVTADDGTVAGNIPTAYSTPSGDFSINLALANDNTELVMTPNTGPQPTRTALDQSNTLMHDALLIGAVFGAAFGCWVGVVLGVWFFVVGAVVGCVVGATIGATIGLFFPI
ncbi:hypothetical protein [Nocardia stercoris]|uniref:DUF8020 domain-containing protein n=1 Tax=Nocardia stercoris TaxID=2483361 RepID=A0A3M2L9D1_9NOCA|nr:hypothetical protein [Nocardia stercoris]RMI34177.1 hypothetical protein EBN03_07080 [Nocardia stercoris]